MIKSRNMKILSETYSDPLTGVSYPELSFIYDFINPLYFSDLTIHEVLLLGSTVKSCLKKDKDSLKETQLTNTIKAYLFLHIHLYHLENQDSQSALPLIQGDILFSDAISSLFRLSVTKSYEILKISKEAFNTGFQILSTNKPADSLFLQHIYNMFPTFLKLPFETEGMKPESEGAFNFGAAFMLHQELRGFKKGIKSTNEPGAFSFMKASLENNSTGAVVEETQNLIISHCHKALKATGHLPHMKFINERVMIIEEELKWLQKR